MENNWNPMGFISVFRHKNVKPGHRPGLVKNITPQAYLLDATPAA
jgi:hypothetical protein